jgi:hypothetical protein
MTTTASILKLAVEHSIGNGAMETLLAHHTDGLLECQAVQPAFLKIVVSITRDMD